MYLNFEWPLAASVGLLCAECSARRNTRLERAEEEGERDAGERGELERRALRQVESRPRPAEVLLLQQAHFCPRNELSLG